MKKTFTTLVLAFFACFSNAQQPEYNPYFVSAILRLNGTDATLKIVQGMVISDSPDNAKIVFTVLATKEFPQYTVIDVLPSSFAQLMKTLPTGKQATPPQQQKGDVKSPT
jgi:hypothetical protein